MAQKNIDYIDLKKGGFKPYLTRASVKNALRQYYSGHVPLGAEGAMAVKQGRYYFLVSSDLPEIIMENSGIEEVATRLSMGF